MVVAEDIMTHPNWLPWRELAIQAGVRSCWSHPILSVDNKVLGTFAIYRREPSTPSAEDLKLIRQSASLAAIASAISSAPALTARPLSVAINKGARL